MAHKQVTLGAPSSSDTSTRAVGWGSVPSVLGSADNADLSALGTASRWLQTLSVSQSGVEQMTVSASAAGDAVAADLPSAWESAAEAITISAPGIANDLVVPGPAHSSSSVTDDTEPYQWISAGAVKAAIGTWVTAYQALSASQQARAVALFWDGAGGTKPAITHPPPDASAPTTVTVYPVAQADGGETVLLDIFTSTDGILDGSLEYQWSVTGGTLDDATLRRPTWTRPSPATETDYTISCTVTARGTGTNAAAGTSDTASHSVTATVNGQGPASADAPTVAIPAVAAGQTGTDVALSATLSGGVYDTLTYAWAVSGGSLDDATSATPTWTRPDTAGSYTVSLTVTASGTGTNAAAGTSDTASANRAASVTAAPIELSDWSTPAGQQDVCAGVVQVGNSAANNTILWNLEGTIVGSLVEGSLTVEPAGDMYRFNHGKIFGLTSHVNFSDPAPREPNADTIFEPGQAYADATVWIQTAPDATPVGVTMADIGAANIGGGGVNVRDTTTGGPAMLAALAALSSGDRIIFALTQPAAAPTPINLEGEASVGGVSAVGALVASVGLAAVAAVGGITATGDLSASEALVGEAAVGGVSATGQLAAAVSLSGAVAVGGVSANGALSGDVALAGEGAVGGLTAAGDLTDPRAGLPSGIEGGTGTQTDPYRITADPGTTVEVVSVLEEAPPSGDTTWFQLAVTHPGDWSVLIETVPTGHDFDSLLYAVPADGLLPTSITAQHDAERTAPTPQTLTVTAIDSTTHLLLEIEDWQTATVTSATLTFTAPAREIALEGEASIGGVTASGALSGAVSLAGEAAVGGVAAEADVVASVGLSAVASVGGVTATGDLNPSPSANDLEGRAEVGGVTAAGAVSEQLLLSDWTDVPGSDTLMLAVFRSAVDAGADTRLIDLARGTGRVVSGSLEVEGTSGYQFDQVRIWGSTHVNLSDGQPPDRPMAADDIFESDDPYAAGTVWVQTGPDATPLGVSMAQIGDDDIGAGGVNVRSGNATEQAFIDALAAVRTGDLVLLAFTLPRTVALSGEANVGGVTASGALSGVVALVGEAAVGGITATGDLSDPTRLALAGEVSVGGVTASGALSGVVSLSGTVAVGGVSAVGDLTASPSAQALEGRAEVGGVTATGDLSDPTRLALAGEASVGGVTATGTLTDPGSLALAGEASVGGITATGQLAAAVGLSGAATVGGLFATADLSGLALAGYSEGLRVTVDGSEVQLLHQSLRIRHSLADGSSAGFTLRGPGSDIGVDRGDDLLVHDIATGELLFSGVVLRLRIANHAGGDLVDVQVEGIGIEQQLHKRLLTAAQAREINVAGSAATQLAALVTAAGSSYAAGTVSAGAARIAGVASGASVGALLRGMGDVQRITPDGTVAVLARADLSAGTSIGAGDVYASSRYDVDLDSTVRRILVRGATVRFIATATLARDGALAVAPISPPSGIEVQAVSRVIARGGVLNKIESGAELSGIYDPDHGRFEWAGSLDAGESCTVEVHGSWRTEIAVESAAVDALAADQTLDVPFASEATIRAEGQKALDRRRQPQESMSLKLILGAQIPRVGIGQAVTVDLALQRLLGVHEPDADDLWLVHGRLLSQPSPSRALVELELSRRLPDFRERDFWAAVDEEAALGRQIVVGVASVGGGAPQVAQVIPVQVLRRNDPAAGIELGPYFSDPDGDSLTYAAASSDTSIATVSVSGSTLSITPVGLGTASVTVTASDAARAAAQLVQVTVVANRAPVSTASLPDQSLRRPPTGARSVQVNLADYFSDPDGDALTYGAVSSNTGRIVPVVSGSTLTLRTATATGDATITVTASDGLASVSQTFTASALANRAPRAAASFPAQALNPVNSPIDLALAPYFSDPDGDSLTYSAVSSDTSRVTVAVSGSTLRLTAGSTHNGSATVTVTASDGALSVSQALTVERSPVITSLEVDTDPGRVHSRRQEWRWTNHGTPTAGHWYRGTDPYTTAVNHSGALTAEQIAAGFVATPPYSNVGETVGVLLTIGGVDYTRTATVTDAS